jgi:DNA topoisomerase-1
MEQYLIDVPKYVQSKPYTFGIAEKPSAAKRLAQTLDEKAKEFSVKVTKKGKVLHIVKGWLITKNKERIVILSALGHLFTLVQDGSGWQYPVYDFKWVPINQASNKLGPKFNDRIEATIEAIRELANSAQKYLVLTDYDEEGEVIGALTLTQLVNNDVLKQARRLKFSSFAKREIHHAFEMARSKSAAGEINFGMYNRGLMRHYLDWLWGINLSRALMLSLKNYSGRYHTLSTGRVQGPTLAFAAKRQLEIDTFVPNPRFKIQIILKKYPALTVHHKKGFIDKLKAAEKIYNSIKDKDGLITEIVKNKRKISSPAPYNLSSLQSDAYRYHKISPSNTLRAAESLYLEAAISYPRTSSEQYPEDMDHQEILTKMGRRAGFKNIVKEIFVKNKKLIPKMGKKTDPAHPCIHPTDQSPTRLSGHNKSIYNLIVHQYFATFGKDAVVESNRVNFTIDQEKFYLQGSRLVTKGWRAWSGIQGNTAKNELPKLSEGQILAVSESELVKSFTQPAPQYNQSSLLKEMENHELGTKATRSEIIQSIINRKYMQGDPIHVTPIGMIVNEVLENYSPQVISVELSRELERMGDLVEEGTKENAENVFSLSDAVVQGILHLHTMLDDLKSNELQMGSLIDRELRTQRKMELIIGTCNVCKEGDLKIIRSQSTGKRFVGCTLYFDNQRCTNTFPLPQRGRLEKTDIRCKADNFPQLRVYGGKKPWLLCLNHECPIREEYLKSVKERKEKEDIEVKIKKTKIKGKLRSNK